MTEAGQPVPDLQLGEREASNLEVADLEIDCPRCGQVRLERFYGPCASCRVEMRASLARTQTELVVTEYEPKMNVTPNAVALKD
jgi:hypothetical protein